LSDNGIQAIKISFSANAEIIEELMGWREDHVLILTIGKQTGVCFNPRISLSDSTRGAETGLASMEDPFFVLTGRTLIQVKTHIFSFALEHLFNVNWYTGSNNLLGMKLCKCFVVICKDLL
jgi:hypothetical protein